jgi:DNA mismatch endonuclease (patch repair protein)
MDRSENMRRIKSKDTSIEVKLRKELWRRGYRYRKNCKDVFGRPDICFKNKKVAIFCDSEFWHGKDYLDKKSLPKTNQDFWERKLKRNIERDKKVNKELKKQGWKVLRFWGREINQNLDICIEKIEIILNY